MRTTIRPTHAIISPPFSGNSLAPGAAPDSVHRRAAGRGVVFVGLNPSYGPGDDPAWGCDFETFDRYWRTHFDRPMSQWARLYQRYQEVGERALEGFALGRDALVLGAVRYRSAKGEGCWDRGVWEHERRTTMALLHEVTPNLVRPS